MRRWGGLGLIRPLSAAPRGRQEREERSWAGFGQERKRERDFSIPSFLFLFLSFPNFGTV
jgi:hypothetical protein